MEYQVAVKPWGNSLGIRIPKELLKKANVNSTDLLSIEVKDEQIILTKLYRHKSFEERLAEYDGKADVCHFDWGEPKGKELI